MRISDWSSDVCSSDLLKSGRLAAAFVADQGGRADACLPGTGIVSTAVNAAFANGMAAHGDETDDSHLGGRFHPGCAVVPAALAVAEEIGRASCRERVCQYV